MTDGDKFHPIVLTVKDFKDLHDRGLLELTPKFQRRSVWTPNAKSYFLDTVVQGLSSPKIYIRERLSAKRELIREVVDGQQRLRTILEFIHNDITIKRKYNVAIGNLKFEAIGQTARDRFLDYKLSVDVMRNVSDEEVLDMFARLNTYTVSLVRQELRNARYHGEFKTAMYNMASKHRGFFLDNHILSERVISRMADAELVSELVIAMIGGLQDKKKSISHYYAKYDKKFEHEDRYTERFEDLVGRIEEIFGEVIRLSSFRNRPLFYSLYCCMYDLEHGLPREKGPYGKIMTKNYSLAKEILSNLSSQIESVSPKPEYAEFVKACARQTDNIIPRKIRHATILNELIPLIGKGG